MGSEQNRNLGVETVLGGRNRQSEGGEWDAGSEDPKPKACVQERRRDSLSIRRSWCCGDCLVGVILLHPDKFIRLLLLFPSLSLSDKEIPSSKLSNLHELLT